MLRYEFRRMLSASLPTGSRRHFDDRLGVLAEKGRITKAAERMSQLMQEINRKYLAPLSTGSGYERLN
jgi:hypothetical protein